MSLHSLLIALALQAPGDGLLTVAHEEVRTWSKFEAASRLLPSDVSASVIDGRFQPDNAFGYYSGGWWDQAKPAGHRLCQRSAYFANVRPDPAGGLSPVPQMQVEVSALVQYAVTAATPSSALCAQQSSWVNTTAEDGDETARMIDLLLEAIAAAAGDQPLPFELAISCIDDGAGACPSARAALRDLPLHALYAVTLHSDRHVNDHLGPGVDRGHALPPLDGVYRKAELAFGMYRAGVESWFVTIEAPDHIDSVAIRRAIVIYH